MISKSSFECDKFCPYSLIPQFRYGQLFSGVKKDSIVADFADVLHVYKITFVNAQEGIGGQSLLDRVQFFVNRVRDNTGFASRTTHVRKNAFVPAAFNIENIVGI